MSKLAVLMLAAVVALFAGCTAISDWLTGTQVGKYQRPAQVLNIPTVDRTGFVNAHRVRGPLGYPEYCVIISEFPGSGAGQASRTFVAAPVRLGSLESLSGGGALDRQQIEQNKVVLEIRNPELVSGLPEKMEAETMAILKYQGTSKERDCNWNYEAVDTGVNTLKLVVTARLERPSDGTNYPNWVCTALPSSGIRAIKEPDQRIRPAP